MTASLAEEIIDDTCLVSDNFCRFVKVLQRTTGLLRDPIPTKLAPMRTRINFGWDTMTSRSSRTRPSMWARKVSVVSCSGPSTMMTSEESVTANPSLWLNQLRKLFMERLTLKCKTQVAKLSRKLEKITIFILLFSRTSVSVSTSEQTRTERVRLTKQMLDKLAR